MLLSGPIHTKQKWERKQKWSKTKQKRSEIKRQTSKKIFVFTQCEWALNSEKHSTFYSVHRSTVPVHWVLHSYQQWAGVPGTRYNEHTRILYISVLPCGKEIRMYVTIRSHLTFAFPSITKLREGNVFSRVCLLIEERGPMSPLPMMHWTSLCRPSWPQATPIGMGPHGTQPKTH